MKEFLVLGLISDTHNLLRSQIHDHFRGVDVILHAGDVGADSILHELNIIAPVIAVRGNTDESSGLPGEASVVLKGWNIYITHQLDARAVSIPKIVERTGKPRPDLVITGHTHKFRHFVEDGVNFINPGSAGPPRYRLQPSIALARCHPDHGVEVAVIGLL